MKVVHLTGRYRPGPLNAHCFRVYLLVRPRLRKDAGGEGVLLAGRKASPQVHLGVQLVVDPPRVLIEVNWLAGDRNQVVDQASAVRHGDILRSEELRG